MKTFLPAFFIFCSSTISFAQTVIWSNDFSNCDDWEIYNAFDEGYLDFINGINFWCTTDGPDGPAAISTIDSPTADNNFMIIDSDVFGGDEPDYIENCWFQNVNAIDCSAYDQVSLLFYNYYRMWDGGSSDGNEYCLVELSTDGVTWPDVTTFEVNEAPPGTRFELWPTMQTQDYVQNPTVKIFNISEVAAGQPTVYLRFRWKGTWGYAWMVDDIMLYETPANDLAVEEVYTGDFVNDFEYYAIPQSQAGEQFFGALIKNYGYQAQENVEITFDLDPYTELTTNVSLQSGESDTVWVNIGVYDEIDELTVHVPDDSLDYLNEHSTPFIITEELYSHCAPAAALSSKNFFLESGEIIVGSLFRIKEDICAHGLSVLFENVEDMYASGDIYLFEYLDSTLAEPGDLVTDGNFYVNGGDEGEYVNGYFEGVVLEAGKTYCAAIAFEQQDETVTLKCKPENRDSSTLCFGPFGEDDELIWSKDWNWTPAIHLIFQTSFQWPKGCGGIGIETITVHHHYNIHPNPATASTTISLSLQKASDVNVIVRDLTGRIIKSVPFGMKPLGENSLELDVSGMASGVYSIGINAGDVFATKMLVVE